MKRKMTIISTTLVLTTLISCLSSCGESAKIKSLISEGKYSDAIKEYNQLESADSELSEIFIKNIEKIFDNFKKEKIDYSEAKSKLKEFSSINDREVKSSSIDISSKINKLNNSRNAFEKAKLLENENNYEEAIVRILFSDRRRQ